MPLIKQTPSERESFMSRPSGNEVTAILERALAQVGEEDPAEAAAALAHRLRGGYRELPARADVASVGCGVERIDILRVAGLPAHQRDVLASRRALAVENIK